MRSGLYLGIIGLVIGFGIINYHRLQRGYRILLALLCITFTEELLIKILAFTGNCETYMVYNIYVVLEYSLLSLVYYQIALRNFNWGREFMITSSIFVILFAFVNSIWWQPINIMMPTNAMLIGFVLYVFQSLITYLYILKSLDSTPIYLKSIFWFNTGCFVFYSTAFFIFGSSHFLSQKIYAFLLNNILYILNIILYSIYGISFYLDVRHIKNK